MRTVPALLIATTVVISVWTTACLDSSSDASTKAIDTPDLTVVRGAFTTETLLTGKLEAEEAALFVTPNANIWPMQIRWLADDGIDVKAGDVVVEYDTSQLDSNLEELRVTVIKAENRWLETKAQLAAEEAEAIFAVEKAEAALAVARLDASVPSGLYAQREYQRRLLDHTLSRGI